MDFRYIVPQKYCPMCAIVSNSIVSIIIPCFNIQDYVGRTIDSIVNQSDPNWEIIAIDDGSTDSTLDVLIGVAQKDNRIHVIHQENRGVSAARNTGLMYARGEWIYFLDGDDLIENDLVKSINNIDRGNEIVVFDFIKESTGIVKRTYKVTNPETLFIDYLTNRQSIHICSIATRRSFILNNNIRFDETTNYGEDREYVAALFALRPNYLCLNKCLYRYQIREGSAVSIQKYDRRRFSSILACERTYNKLKGCREERKALAVLAFTITRHIKMYYAYDCKDATLGKELNRYAAKYLKGFHYYGIGHIEIYTSIAGIIALNFNLFRLLVKFI